MNTGRKVALLGDDRVYFYLPEREQSVILTLCFVSSRNQLTVFIDTQWKATYTLGPEEKVFININGSVTAFGG